MSTIDDQARAWRDEQGAFTALRAIAWARRASWAALGHARQVAVWQRLLDTFAELSSTIGPPVSVYEYMQKHLPALPDVRETDVALNYLARLTEAVKEAEKAMKEAQASNVVGTWTLPSGLAVTVTLRVVLNIAVTPEITDPRDRAAFLEDVLPDVDVRARAKVSAVPFTLANTNVHWRDPEEPA